MAAPHSRRSRSVSLDAPPCRARKRAGKAPPPRSRRGMPSPALRQDQQAAAIHRLDLSRSVRHVSPVSRRITEARRRKRCAERRDPNADQHLRRIAEVLSEHHAETYHYWLAGEFLAEIGDRYGLTAEAIRLRLKRVRQLLDAGRSAPDG